MKKILLLAGLVLLAGCSTSSQEYYQQSQWLSTNDIDQEQVDGNNFLGFGLGIPGAIAAAVGLGHAAKAHAYHVDYVMTHDRKYHLLADEEKRKACFGVIGGVVLIGFAGEYLKEYFKNSGGWLVSPDNYPEPITKDIAQEQVDRNNSTGTVIVIPGVAALLSGLGHTARAHRYHNDYVEKRFGRNYRLWDNERTEAWHEFAIGGLFLAVADVYFENSVEWEIERDKSIRPGSNYPLERSWGITDSAFFSVGYSPIEFNEMSDNGYTLNNVALNLSLRF